MIFVEISKDGIEKVSVRAACEAEQDLDLKIWPVVRRGLNRLNRDLERRGAARTEKDVRSIGADGVDPSQAS
jgi:hypothetical protein